MKLHYWTPLVFFVLGSAAAQAQPPCDIDGYGNYVCDEVSEDFNVYNEEENEEDTVVDQGVPTGIPGIPTHPVTIRRSAANAPAAAQAAPPPDDDGNPGEIVREVSDDGLGNYRARTRDGRVLYGAPDAYGDLGWRDVRGNRVECAFDQSGRLICY